MMMERRKQSFGEHGQPVSACSSRASGSRSDLLLISRHAAFSSKGNLPPEYPAPTGRCAAVEVVEQIEHPVPNGRGGQLRAHPFSELRLRAEVCLAPLAAVLSSSHFDPMRPSRCGGRACHETVYDTLSRSELQNGQALPSVSSYGKPEVNADGSIDIMFGPTEPQGGGNWIKTVPGKGWFPIFRFYSPTEAYFDKTWALNDIEALQ